LISSFINSIKSALGRSDGLGYLQLYSMLKTLAIVVIAIIFANFINNSELINKWESLLLLSTALTFFYVSGFGYTLISLIKRYEKSRWSQIFNSTFLLLIILSCVSVIVVAFISVFYWNGTFTLTQILFFSIYIIGNVGGTITEYIYFLNGSFKKLIAWGLLNFILLIAASTFPLILGFNFTNTTMALALTGIIRLSITLAILDNPFTVKSFTFFMPLMKFNWPVILSLLAGTGYIYIAGFILKSNVSTIDFNLYRYGSRDFPLFVVMTNSFSIVLGGLATSGYLKPAFWLDVKKSHIRLMHQLFPLACIFMLTSSYVFQVVFSENFVPAHTVFNILLLTLIPRMLFPQSLLMGIGKTRYSFYASVLEFLCGIILVIILVPSFGIEGAAWGILIAYLLEKFILILFCYKENIPFHKSANIYWYGAYCLILIFCFFIDMIITV
jgi:O-antigen/teichoic acid export membrane protein